MPPRTYDSHVSVAIHKLLVPLHPFIRFIQLTYQELRHWLILLFVSFYQQTSLHLAANGGHAVTVESLLNKGADINITDKDGVSYTRLLRSTIVFEYELTSPCIFSVSTCITEMS